MKIESGDGQSWIDIELHGDSDYSSYDVRVQVDIDHGLFTARNSDLQFLHWSESLRNLVDFITNKGIQVVFEGTYDSYLKFSRSKGSKPRVLVDFAVGDAFVGRTRTHEFLLRGGFEIDEESMPAIVEKISAMTLPHNAASRRPVRRRILPAEFCLAV